MKKKKKAEKEKEKAEKEKANPKDEKGEEKKKKSSRKDKHVRPTLAHGINAMKLDIKKICSGQDHTIILTKDGTVYALGRNNFGQLGLNKDEDVKEPQKVSIGSCSDISCGANHSLFLTNEGQVFACGLSKDDRFPSKDEKLKKPTKVVDGIDGLKIIGLSSGKKHNLLVSQTSD